jgi:hypothetical protein
MENLPKNAPDATSPCSAMATAAAGAWKPNCSEKHWSNSKHNLEINAFAKIVWSSMLTEKHSKNNVLISYLPVISSLQ